LTGLQRTKQRLNKPTERGGGRGRITRVRNKNQQNIDTRRIDREKERGGKWMGVGND